MRRLEFKSIVIFIIAVFCICNTAGVAFAQQAITVNAAIKSQNLYRGESFIFQIRVDGSDSPQEPVVPALSGFKIEFQSGQQNNSQSVTIVNGQMKQEIKKSYIFLYRLTALKLGVLTIEPFTVQVDGQTFTTQAIQISSSEPRETDDFKLRIKLSKQKAYVGEPVILTVTWYIAKDIANGAFTIPVLSDKNFLVDELPPSTNNRSNLIRFAVGGDEVIAQRGQENLDGGQFTTVSFSKVLIPKSSGRHTIESAVVAFDVIVQRARGFGRNKTRRQVVPSNQLTLEVADVPQQDRPVGFEGHIAASYSIETHAVPLEVNVGDPVTLTVTIRGPEFMKHVDIPDLHKQDALFNGFKIPKEMEAGKLVNGAKVFTQTIRARHSKVKEIPALNLHYFNTSNGRYELAQSKAIPLTVNETKVITAIDAEGTEGTTVKTELVTIKDGIAYNYDDLSALNQQHDGLGSLLRQPMYATALALPAVVYGILFMLLLMARKNNQNPVRKKARLAFSELSKATKNISSTDPQFNSAILSALQAYLGAKLGFAQVTALTFADIDSALNTKGVSADILQEIKALFEQCEASRYAGGATQDASQESLVQQLMDLAKRLEGALK